ncbi:hypothetical protein [Sulfurisphaera ohwakuensis]|uniref:Nucleotidyltransferase AbiEii toxin of type IV toxin-antitoxin system n=1 Tax=Sulfurisphaera ohwakuensis TaxID=69656 RepID=A0A650CDR7_SULOH|nr:hypothetical protein [Sulfurisphaera ohwakuensis]QGR15980.1 hypothetical protein D1869_01370 [Sulfurisphaera ohwakuensis]
MAITKEQLLERGKEIVDKAREKNVILRLIGGAAVAILAPKGSEVFARKYKDIDFFGISSQSKKISEVLESVGMIGNKRFNALHGDRRLMFYDPKIDSTVDVFLDVFEMCHKITLKDRLAIMPYTIPPSDLLLTKLQIIKLTENDVKDLFALLTDLELGDHDDGKTIDINYIAKLLADDWGFYTTVTDNIEKLLNEFNPPSNVAEKLRILKEKIEKEPKSLKWKMRAKIGRKVKWYEEPEEVGQFKISGESL